MNIWAPEPCTTDTETVAEAKVDETIRVIIGSAIAERSNNDIGAI